MDQNTQPEITEYTIARWRLVAEAAVITKEQYEELVAADKANDYERFTAAQEKLENQYSHIPDGAVAFWVPDGTNYECRWIAFEGNAMGGIEDLVSGIPAQDWDDDCFAPSIFSNDYFSYLQISNESSND